MSIDRTVKWWACREEWTRVWGTKEAQILSVKLLDSLNRETGCIEEDDTLTVRVEFQVREDVEEPHFGIAIFRKDGLYCFGPNTVHDGYKIDSIKKGRGWFAVTFIRMPFAPGKYRISVGIWDKKEVLPYSYHPGRYKLEIAGSRRNYAVNINSKWKKTRFFSRRPLCAEDHIEPDMSFLSENWKRELRSTEMDITRIEILDKAGAKKETFKRGESISINIYMDKGAVLKPHHLWTGIFRKDQVYCHGVARRINHEKKISLIWPSISLLNGDYRISVAVLNGSSSARPVTLLHALCAFKISCNNNYHGLAYVEHKWRWRLP